MSKEILIRSCKHIDFVPNKYVKDNYIADNCICVFSRKSGKRINKRKHRFVGLVIFCHNEHGYGFGTIANTVLSEETLQIISHFVKALNNKVIRFDRKKGEFVE